MTITRGDMSLPTPVTTTVFPPRVVWQATGLSLNAKPNSS